MTITETIPETPIGERVAADLRTLADLAVNRPELAEHIAATVAQLFVVLPLSSELGIDDFLSAAITAAATPLPAFAWSEPHWPTRELLLPAQLIRITVTKLEMPAELVPQPGPRETVSA